MAQFSNTKERLLQHIMREGEDVAASNTIDDGAKSYFCLLVIVFQHNGFHSSTRMRLRRTTTERMRREQHQKLNGLKTKRTLGFNFAPLMMKPKYLFK